MKTKNKCKDRPFRDRYLNLALLNANKDAETDKRVSKGSSALGRLRENV